MRPSLLRAALRGSRAVARLAQRSGPCPRAGAAHAPSHRARGAGADAQRTAAAAAACGLLPPPCRPGHHLRLHWRAPGPGACRLACGASSQGRGGASEAPQVAGAHGSEHGDGDEGEEALGGEGHEESGDEDGLYLDVDVMIVESTPETPQLASLAADVEATAPLLLQAVLDVPPHVTPPRALAAVRAGAAGAELSVALCGDDYIRALNAEWRGVDEATDVLSFPQVEVSDDDGDGDGDDDDNDYAGLFPGGHALLGDVIISVDTAARQAAARGASLEEEVQVLLVHGLLHLLGYDHDDVPPEDAAAMAGEESRVLNRMGWGGIGLVTSAHTGTITAAAAAAAAASAPAAATRRRRRTADVDVLLCDLDGTLLTSSGAVSPATADALRAAQAAGVSVYVATGKARPGAVAALAASGLSVGESPLCGSATPGVFLNGVLVYATAGALTFQRQLPFDAVTDALALAASSPGVAVAVFTGDRCFSLAPSPLLDALHVRFYEPKAELLPDVAALAAVAPPPVKVLLYAPSAAHIDALRPRAEALLAGRAHVVQAVPDMLEVLPLGASKGAGAQRLLHALGVPPERAAAIGDGENDLDMLRCVGLGLAMANAVPVTRAAASHVLSRSNDEDGVAEAIEKYIL